MSDLEHAKPRDVFERDGVRWVVIGLVHSPAVLLQREDCLDLTTSEHTRHCVIPTSHWAGQWRSVADVVDPLLIEARRIAYPFIDGMADDILTGGYDSSAQVCAALAALKRGVELGKEQVRW